MLIGRERELTTSTADTRCKLNSAPRLLYLRGILPGRDPLDIAEIYGMVGDVPLYLMQFQGEGALRELTESALPNPNTILYEEPSNLLMQEASKAADLQAGRQLIPLLAPIRGAPHQMWRTRVRVVLQRTVSSSEMHFALRPKRLLALKKIKRPAQSEERRTRRPPDSSCSYPLR